MFSLSSVVSLDFDYFLLCRLTSELWKNVWNYVVNKNVLNKYVLYFRFFSRRLLLCWQFCSLSVRFMSLSPGIVFNSSQSCWATLSSLCGPTHPRPSQLGLVLIVGVLLYLLQINWQSVETHELQDLKLFSEINKNWLLQRWLDFFTQ